MSVAIYIVAERDIDDLDTFVNGKALAHAEQEDIDTVCANSGIKSPYEYVSQDPDELRETLEEFGGDVPDELPDEQWFEAAEGLSWVESLMTYLAQNHDALDDQAAILEDLEEYAGVFRQLKEHGVRWHFAVDF